MKLQTKISLAFAGTLAVVAIAGCPNMLPVSTNPTPTPNVSPASKLQGRITFALNTDGTQDPGEKLVLKVKRKKAGETEFTTLNNATTSTDVKGNYTFENLEDADYQVVYDDGGTVVTGTDGFNVTGVAVSDAVAVSKTQTAVPQVNMEIAWNFNNTANWGPKTDTTIARQNVPFNWQAKAGVSDASYWVTIFKDNGGVPGSATLSSPSATVGTANTTLTFGIPANAGSASGVTYEGTPTGVNYYVVKYYKTGGGWGNKSSNYYGQTKMIRFTLNN